MAHLLFPSLGHKEGLLCFSGDAWSSSPKNQAFPDRHPEHSLSTEGPAGQPQGNRRKSIGLCDTVLDAH